jgi:hypothetical protein
MEVLAFWILMNVVFVGEAKINYDACKKEDFKPKVCERYKTLQKK